MKDFVGTDLIFFNNRFYKSFNFVFISAVNHGVEVIGPPVTGDSFIAVADQRACGQLLTNDPGNGLCSLKYHHGIPGVSGFLMPENCSDSLQFIGVFQVPEPFDDLVFGYPEGFSHCLIWIFLKREAFLKRLDERLID
ncbi:hypothetical protein SDC9_207062 [bioreactor metagenome]|uniref:Uncharacterized protein n=1 Tax=bioreactor metagenome TaxID=1076179 RepID=A0A645J6U7_9ZZZZ